MNFKKIFNWDIYSVSIPEPVFDTTPQHQLTGYMVTVYYKHHGVRNVFFSVDFDGAWVVYGEPREEAEVFYHDMRKKLLNQNTKKRGFFSR